MNIVKRTSGYFSYNKKTFTFKSSLPVMGLSRFPEVLEIVSVHTGRIVRYVQDTAAAMKAEYWDGEMMEYFTHETDVNRTRVIIEVWGQ